MSHLAFVMFLIVEGLVNSQQSATPPTRSECQFQLTLYETIMRQQIQLDDLKTRLDSSTTSTGQI